MRRGTSSACAKRTHSSWPRLRSASTNEDTSFTRSRDPCTSLVSQETQRFRYRGRANPRKWEKPAPGSGRWTHARLAARHRFSSEKAGVTRQKRKVVMAIVPARKREPRAQCPYVVVQLQKSAGRIPASNKLVRSAPKRVAVRVNGGLARHGRRRESAGGDAARNESWRVGLHVRFRSGGGPAETQDGVRTSFSGRLVTERWWGGRGAGAVKATGSYEGSLSVEVTSGRHEPAPFTRRWSRRPRRLAHAGRR